MFNKGTSGPHSEVSNVTSNPPGIKATVSTLVILGLLSMSLSIFLDVVVWLILLSCELIENSSIKNEPVQK